MGYSITSLSQIIDATTIKNGCNKIIEAAGELDVNASYIDAGISTSGRKVCDIATNSKAYSEMVADIGTKINELKALITNIAEAISSEASDIYEKEYKIYQEYLDWCREQEKAKAEKEKGE